LESSITGNIHKGTSDEKLVDMTINGNTLAFRMLIEKHSGYVSGIASRFLLSHEDTRDVVQDTFIRIWKHLGSYDKRSLFTTWLYSIAFNLCLDKLRINRRRRAISLTEEHMNEPGGKAESENPSQNMDSGTISRAIGIYAEKLSTVQRQVFVLRDLQDLPVDEVCRITGYDTDKVKSNLYHARKFMREKLLKGGYL
jgi:RNA polymerase sigma-70 factor (ECF subfamily)